MATWILPVCIGLAAAAAVAEEALPQRASTCPVAREMAVKGVDLFANQPDKGLAALDRAYGDCPDDLGVAFNTGLAHFLSGHLEQAREVWTRLHQAHPDHLKTQANLAWTQFQVGDDESAHILAFEGLTKHPGNLDLAHTKIFALFRMGRYLEAYDWLTRANLKGVRAAKWREEAVAYVVEGLWRRFRTRNGLEAVRQAVNMLVKEYPDEAAFVAAKDQLVLAEVDSDAEVPYSSPLPHEVWPKQGDVDDQRQVLDDFITALPSLTGWAKRTDAFALLVGINQYKKLRGRHFADRDARNLGRVLAGRGFFFEDHDHLRVRTNAEATAAVIQSDLHWLITQGRVNPNAMLLFHFSGHGRALSNAAGTRVDDVLLVPVEARPETITPATAISLMDLKRQLEQLPNQEIVIIIDACFNGHPDCALEEGQTDPPLPPGLFAGPKPWAVAALAEGAGIYGPGRQRAFSYFLMKG
ncbi:MAG: caspase family protein, partial [Magnetococcales bacterium]|nr:caspase family protein [Magnetococcales bacterium]